MNCAEAAERVSALFDGQPISREAAAHLSDCEECRARLNDYAEMGAEMRRIARAIALQAIPEGRWRLAEAAVATNWLKNWRGTMRIPRLAFALMLVAIFALLGGIALKARPGGSGAVLLLTIKLPHGAVSHCTFNMDLADGHQHCTHGTDINIPGHVWVGTRYVKREADRVQLAIKTKYTSERTGEHQSDALAGTPEQEYWLEPDRTLEAQIAGLGTMEITGQFLDYTPAAANPNEPLDPGPDEFRLWHPVLICENRVLVNVSSSSATDTGNNAATALYTPGLGRFVFSTVPFEGATEGKIQVSQMSFTMEGKSYLVLTGAPISRSEHVWVLHQPDWRPLASALSSSGDHPILGSGNLHEVLEKK
jgi:hypothetical protein